MAFEPGTSTGAVATGSNVTKTGPGRLTTLCLTAAAATSTVTVYDNTSAAGTILMAFSTVANTSTVCDFAAGIVYDTGITIVVTGSGATAYAIYCPGA